MLYIPNDEMFVNKFVEVHLPSKKQIFARTGQHAVSPGGAYSGDDAVHFKDSPTSGLNRMVRDAESFDSSKSEKSEK